LLRDYIGFADGGRMALAGVGSRRTMDRAQYAAARASALARMLTGAQGASIDHLSALVRGLLEAAGMNEEQRIEILGGAFVAEAVAPHWGDVREAGLAHDSLRTADEELADAVEAVAQVLLGRTQSRDEAAQALAELDRLFAASPRRNAPGEPSPQLWLPEA